MSSKDLFTLTGLPLADVTQRLDEELEPAAYAAVPGGADLTEIKPAWLTAALNAVFGLAGHGWWYEYQLEHLNVTPTVQQTRNGSRDVFAATVDRFEFYYRLVDTAGEELVVGPVLSNGGSTNDKHEYAVRGAITNAIGAAAAKLGWQLSVYQNKRSHRTLQANVAPHAVMLTFGKHNGKTLGEAPEDYVSWLAENARDAQLRAAAQQLVAGKGNGNGAQPKPVARPASGNGKDKGNGNGQQPPASAPANPGQIKLTFGKHKGQTLAEVFKAVPDYVEWLAKSAHKPEMRAAATALLQAQAAPPAQLVDYIEDDTAKSNPLAAAQAFVLPFGTRNNPEYKGMTLAAIFAQDVETVKKLAHDPAMDAYPAVRNAAQTLVQAQTA